MWRGYRYGCISIEGADGRRATAVHCLTLPLMAG